MGLHVQNSSSGAFSLDFLALLAAGDGASDSHRPEIHGEHSPGEGQSPDDGRW